jgi:Acyclic terpene utilisation family protein AtuA
MIPTVKPVRIGNAHAFWGDRVDAAAAMLAREPDLDYLTLDYLAEVSMSILAVQRDRDPRAGFAGDFIDVVRSLTPADSIRAVAPRPAARPSRRPDAPRYRSLSSPETTFWKLFVPRPPTLPRQSFKTSTRAPRSIKFKRGW